MARFRFRLETLRRLREMTRDELRARLAEAYRAEEILAEQRAANAKEGAELAELRRQLTQSGVTDVARLVTAQRYQVALESQGRALADQAGKIAEEVELRRQAVIEADRQVRVLDKLHDRQLERHNAAAQAADSKRMDEVAMTRREERV